MLKLRCTHFLAALALATASEALTHVQSAGATLPAELYRQSGLVYQVVEPDVLVTYDAIGSGAGLDDILADKVDFAGSDAVLATNQRDEAPDIQYYASVAGAVVPNYNIDGISGEADLVLTREVLAGIFLGEIRSWGDPAFQEDNPSLVLPDINITVVVRLDSSGTSEIFTSALSSFSSKFDAAVGSSHLPDWCQGDTSKVMPIPEVVGVDMLVCGDADISDGMSFVRAEGNLGVATAVSLIPNSIGYVVLTDASALGVRMAHMVNKAGDTVAPSVLSLSYAVMELGGSFEKDGTASLVDASSSTAWPIAGYTYFVLRTSTQISTCEVRSAAVVYLRWFYESDNVAEIAMRLGFATLPPFIRDRVVSQLISEIMCVDADGTEKLAYFGSNITIVEARVPVSTTALLQSMLDIYREGFGVESTVHTNTTSAEVFEQLAEGSSTYYGFAMGYESGMQNALQVSGDLSVVSAGFGAEQVLFAAAAPIYRLSQLNTNGDGVSDVELVLDGAALAAIYLGNISRWDDPRLKALNPSAAAFLPDEPIILVTLSGPCDVTYTLTRWLSAADEEFARAIGETYYFDASAFVGNRSVTFDCVAGSQPGVLFLDNSLGFAFVMQLPEGINTAAVRQAGEIVRPDAAGMQACVDNATTVGDSHYHSVYMNTAKCWPGTEPLVAAYSTENAGATATECSELKVAMEFLRWGVIDSSVRVLLGKGGVLDLSGDAKEKALQGFAQVSCRGNKLLSEYVCDESVAADVSATFSECSKSHNIITASYQWSAASDCIELEAPPGPENLQCQHLVSGFWAGAFAYALCGVCLVTDALMFVLWVIAEWKRVAPTGAEATARHKQRYFLTAVIWTLGVSLALASLAHIGTKTRADCVAQRWFIPLLLALLFAVLLSRVHSVCRFFFSDSLKIRKAMAPGSWAFRSVVLALPVLIATAVISGVKPAEVVPYYTSAPYTDDQLVQSVCQESSPTSLMLVPYGYIAVLAAGTIYLSVRVMGSADFAKLTYNFKSISWEAQAIVFSCYSISVTYLVVFVLLVAARLKPWEREFLGALYICIIGTAPVLLVVAPQLSSQRKNQSSNTHTRFRDKMGFRTRSTGSSTTPESEGEVVPVAAAAAAAVHAVVAPAHGLLKRLGMAEDSVEGDSSEHRARRHRSSGDVGSGAYPQVSTALPGDDQIGGQRVKLASAEVLDPASPFSGGDGGGVGAEEKSEVPLAVL